MYLWIPFMPYLGLLPVLLTAPDHLYTARQGKENFPPTASFFLF